MTDLRARLADALREANNSWFEDCDDKRTQIDALAAALLSLPGIAIVDTDGLAQEIWQAYVVVVGRALPEGVADQMAALVAAANAESPA